MLLKFLPRPLQRLKFAWRHLAQRRTACIVLAGAIPVLLHVALYPPPQPVMHDEFAYLLQADTFAHGRFVNPPRPLWEHFEQVHVISQPVFAVKFQPLPAAILAVGQIAGSPYYGLLISAALTFSAAMWMLYGWLPPSYALLGWVIALTRWGPTTYWMNSYWGGLVPALGGILVVGAWPRLREAVSVRDSILFGLGMVVLAASRPYEGLVLSAAACVTLLIVNRRGWHWMLWAAPVAAAGGALLLFYDFKVTGNPWVPPYVVHDQQYGAVSNFLFVPPKAHPPVYRHAELQALFADRYVQDYMEYKEHPWGAQWSKLGYLWDFYCAGWPLSLALACALFAWRNPRMRWALLMLALFIAGLIPLNGHFPHYASPAAGLLIVVQMAGLHALRYWNPQGRPTGSLLARVAMLAVVMFFARDVIERPRDYPSGDALYKSLRAGWIAQLEAEPGKHIVLVRYPPSHNPHIEYVANGAEFDDARILWARSMGADEDRKFIDYFHDRQIWWLEGDAPPAQLPCIAHCGTAEQTTSRISGLP